MVAGTVRREGSGPDLLLWQDVRARAIDAQLDADRRVVGERVAGWLRWLFLVAFALVLGIRVSGLRPVVAGALVLAWAGVNVFLTFALSRHWRPSAWASIATLAMDLLLGTALMFLVLGPENVVLLAFFLVAIAGASRLGTAATITAAFLSALAFGIAQGAESPLLTIGQMFLFLSVALVVSLMSQELERERRVAIGRAAQADAMREMGVSMSSSLDIKDVFGVTLQHALRMSGADRGGLHLVFQEAIDLAAGEALDEARVREVAGRGEAHLGRDDLFIPLASGEGVTAVLGLVRAGRPFNNEDLFTINALTGSMAVPLANALRYRTSAREAARDAITGLVNHREMRRRLEAELNRRRGTDRGMAFVLIDVDRFKQVNDTMGHQHGDEVLRLAAASIRSTVRSQDVVARYGGDEMAVILLDASPEGARLLADRIVEAARAARIQAAPGKALTLSVGVANFPHDALTADELVTAADQALYVSKREGRDRATAFGVLVNWIGSQEPMLLEMLREAGPQIAVAAGHVIDLRLDRPGRSSLVAALADALARRAAPGANPDTLRAASFVEDIGALSADERMHALEGERLLTAAGFPVEVTRVIRFHHERWDGTGSPDGLAGDQIPVEARVIGVASAYEAAVRTQRSPSLAVAAVEAVAGAYDPAVVLALKALLYDQTLPLVPPLRSPAPAPLAAAT
jgi:diguanylate cyclase (GGDEF)-like protein